MRVRVIRASACLSKERPYVYRKSVHVYTAQARVRVRITTMSEMSVHNQVQTLRALVTALEVHSKRLAGDDLHRGVEVLLGLRPRVMVQQIVEPPECRAGDRGREQDQIGRAHV